MVDARSTSFDGCRIDNRSAIADIPATHRWRDAVIRVPAPPVSILGGRGPGAGAVAQRSFPDYPLLTLAEAPPRIEVHFCGERPGLGRPRRAWVAAGRPGSGERDFRPHRPSSAHPAARRRGAKACRRIGGHRYGSIGTRASTVQERGCRRTPSAVATIGPSPCHTAVSALLRWDQTSGSATGAGRGRAQ